MTKYVKNNNLNLNMSNIQMCLDGNYLFCESIIVFFTNKEIVHNILSIMIWLFKSFK